MRALVPSKIPILVHKGSKLVYCPSRPLKHDRSLNHRMTECYSPALWMKADALQVTPQGHPGMLKSECTKGYINTAAKNIFATTDMTTRKKVESKRLPVVTRRSCTSVREFPEVRWPANVRAAVAVGSLASKCPASLPGYQPFCRFFKISNHYIRFIANQLTVRKKHSGGF